MRAMVKVLGAGEMAQRLLSLGGPPLAKSMRASLQKSIKMIEKAEKSAAPSGKPTIRAAIGSHVDTKSGHLRAKAGAAVGKKINRTKTDTSRRAGRGVGISARNIHWYILGTVARSTGSKRIGRNSHKAGYGATSPRALTGKPVHSTGRMPAHPFIRRAAEAAFPEAMRELELDLNDLIQKEWKKSKGAGG